MLAHWHRSGNIPIVATGTGPVHRASRVPGPTPSPSASCGSPRREACGVSLPRSTRRVPTTCWCLFLPYQVFSSIDVIICVFHLTRRGLIGLPHLPHRHSAFYQKIAGIRIYCFGMCQTSAHKSLYSGPDSNLTMSLLDTYRFCGRQLS